MTNYFTLFDLPEHPVVDRRKLQQAYVYALRKVHPDHHSGQGDLEEKTADSSLVNGAFQQLKTSQGALEHFLSIKGLVEEGDKFQLPPHLLMEMLELNELAMEDEAQYRNERLKLEEMLNEEFQLLSGKLQEKAGDERHLQALKLWYYKRKYFERLPAV